LVKITYIEPSGAEKTIEARVHHTVMETAIKHNIVGIDADCGGACACATCHVYVDEAWLGVTGKAAVMEESMLDFAQDQRPNSRLSCQIVITEAMDGLKVTIPENQH